MKRERIQIKVLELALTLTLINVEKITSHVVLLKLFKIILFKNVLFQRLERWMKILNNGFSLSTTLRCLFCFKSISWEIYISDIVKETWALINLRWGLIAVLRNSGPIVWAGSLFTNLFKTVSLEHESNSEKINDQLKRPMKKKLQRCAWLS